MVLPYCFKTYISGLFLGMWVLSFVVKKALLGNVKVMFVHFS